LINCLVYRHTVITGSGLQHIAHHIITMTRVTDADAQPQEILAAKLRNQVTQTIMTAMATTFFKLYGTCRQIQIIMHNEHGTQWNPIETGQ